MSMIQPLLGELEQESASIRAFIEALPEDKLDWKPHPKSWTLGQLAHHMAVMPGNIAEMAQVDNVSLPEFGAAEQPSSRKELLEVLETALGKANSLLAGLGDNKMAEDWKVMDGDAVAFSLPRVALVRGLMLNHIYHHRGQLSVYLRLLDVPVPVSYGASADVNPFQG